MNGVAASPPPPPPVWLWPRLRLPTSTSTPGYVNVNASSFQNKSSRVQTTPRFTVKINRASSSSAAGAQPYAEEPATGVNFTTSVTLPGCSASLDLWGTGYREKVFAIIGVKVYAAGFYINPSIVPELSAWKGKSKDDIQDDKSLFGTVLKAPLEKSLQIVLLRDLDGKTFWYALDDAISPRITAPTPTDESALSTFRSIFEGRPLKKGTFIFLTWLDSSKMLVSVSSGGWPTIVDAELRSDNVTSSLFDVFFGASPVSPSLKMSVASSLASVLK